MSQNNFVLGRGGKPRLASPTLEVMKNDDGSGYTFSLQARSKAEARRLLLDGDLEEALGRPLAKKERQDILKSVAEAKAQDSHLPFNVNESLDIGHQYRSVAHTLIKWGLSLVGIKCRSMRDHWT